MKWEYIFSEAKSRALAQHATKVASRDDAENVVAVQLSINPEDVSYIPILPQNLSDEVQPISRNICEVINQVRSRPSQFVEILESYLDLFIDDFVCRDKSRESDVNIRTVEGKDGVRDAIAFLKKQISISSLDTSLLLERAALDHAGDLSLIHISGPRD